MAKVPVYSKATGDQVLVPESWMANKKLAAPYRKTPPTKGTTQQAPAASGGDTDTKKEH